MEEKTKYYLLKQKAVPEVLLKVAEAKKLIASEKAMTIQEATDQLGISRSSFYKYKDDIFPFYDNAKGKHEPTSDGLFLYVRRLSGGDERLAEDITSEAFFRR